MKHCNVLLNLDRLDDSFGEMIVKLEQVGCIVTVSPHSDCCLEGADIFIGKRMSEKQLLQADRLKVVFAYKTGVDEFPLSELDKRGIALVNSHVNSNLIAEYAIGLAVCLVNRIADFDRNMRKGNWLLDNPYWDNLFDMKVGLVGYGGIGKACDQLLRRMGIDTYTLNRGKKYPIPTCNTLEELCETCDLLILSLPKTEQTDNMFDERTLKLLKGKYIVNVGRSNAINEEALYNALASGSLKGAAIDTWRQKPQSASQLLLPYDHPFETLDNVVMSSHKAMQTASGHAHYVKDTLQSVLQYLKDGTLVNLVNLKKGY